MNTDTERVLTMLSEDKITVDEAERLLEALSGLGPIDRRAPGPNPDRETRNYGNQEQEARDNGDWKEPVGHRSGVQIGTGAYVSPDVELPPGTVVRTGASVHEGVVVEGPVKIGSGANIDAGAHLMKNCKIGSGANIGAGASVGSDAAIGMGANIGVGAKVSAGSRIPKGQIVPAGTVW